jgi:hypothetical protein
MVRNTPVEPSVIEPASPKASMEARLEASERPRVIPEQNFFQEADNLVSMVSAFQGHPGWPEMKQIIQHYWGTQLIEGEGVAIARLQYASMVWESKWHLSTRHFLGIYDQLAHKSAEIARKQQALRFAFAGMPVAGSPEVGQFGLYLLNRYALNDMKLLQFNER